MKKGNFNFLIAAVLQNVNRLLIAVVAFAGLTAAHAQTKTLDIAELPKLESGKTVERELKGGDAVFFSAKVRRGELLRIDGEEFATDYTLVLAMPDTLALLAVSDFGVRFDRESVFYVAEEADREILVLIRADKRQTEKSRFRLTATIKTADETDRQRVEAATIQLKAYKSLNEGTPESLAAARIGLEKSAKLWSAVGENYWTAYSLNYAGMALVRLGKNAEALPFLEAALPLWKAAGAKNGEADSNGVLGALYFQTGENRRAIEALKTASELVRTVGDRRSEKNYLESLSGLHAKLGEREKRLVYAFAAFLRLEHDDANLANMLREMGVNQESFGNFPFAVELYKLALDYAGGDKRQRADILSNLTDVYIALERFPEAAEIADSALKINGESGGGNIDAAIIWQQTAEINLRTGEKTKAREATEKMLSLAASIDDRTTRAIIFNTAGAVYNGGGEAEKALPILRRALVESKAAGVYLVEADAFRNLMLAERALKNDRLAAFFGKQAINILQNQRSMLKTFDAQKNVNFGSLDRSGQKSFLKSSENSYKKLAEVLIENDRLAEAHEVLIALKDQQLLDFNADAKTKLTPLSATAREAVGNQKFALAGKTVADLSWKLRGYSFEEPNEKNKAEAAQTERRLDAAIGEYANILKQIETDFAAPVSDKDRAPDIAAVRDLQTTLRESEARTKQKSAAIYQLVGDDFFSSLLITADDITKVTTPANGKKLEEKALHFWALLQTSTYDPTKISREIYEIVFKPLEAKLSADTKTLLWIADGNLRYVPPAALFDGKKYLVERFNHVAFTRRAASERKQTGVGAPRWTGTGFGSAAAHTVELNDERISFAALTGVTDELNKIFTAKDKVLTGAIFPNAKFTKTNFLAALRLKRPVVHVASHFSFRAGDEANSFLLMGDGSAFTLTEMKAQPKLFDGVELLTLSACNTAAQQTGANGREIDGFAELAQRLGAGAVMATLWSVADSSTPALMKSFYQLKLDKNLSKAEALRQAQIALLSGTSQAKPAATRSDSSPIEIVLTDKNAQKQQAENTRSNIIYLNKQDAPAWDKSKHAPFAHPFYWSPFVLFGNWR